MENSKALTIKFLDKLKSYSVVEEPKRVLRSNCYQIGKCNILIRAASDLGKRYFFGLNYINAEEIYNLENSYIAFICGDIERVVFFPADEFIKLSPQISHDRNGEYKINFTRNLELVLKGKNNTFNCKEYLNNWKVIRPYIDRIPNDDAPIESFHNIIQGRLLEIGNMRGFETYTPDKKKKFNNIPLEDYRKLFKCPELQFSDYDLLRQIDVIWFRKATNSVYYPEYAFEIELSTGVWPGFSRLATLREYNTKLFIITYNTKRLRSLLQNHLDLTNRYISIKPEHIGLLYSAEKRIIELRNELNI